MAGGHEAHVGAEQEEHEARVGERHAAGDLDELVLAQVQRDSLEHEEDGHDGGKAERDFLQVDRQIGREELEGLLGGVYLGDGEGRVGDAGGVEEQAQHHDGKDRSHAADGHDAEGVLVLAGQRRQARSHGDDERHGDGAGGDAARVEGNGEELVGHEARQAEHERIEAHHQVAQRDAELHAQEGHHEEDAHACGHSHDERGVGHGGHLAGEHLQVGLGHGDGHADGQADAHDEEGLIGGGELFADGAANRHHRDVGPEGEEARAGDKKNRAQDEEKQGADGHGRDGEREKKDDCRDGKDCCQ